MACAAIVLSAAACTRSGDEATSELGIESTIESTTTTTEPPLVRGLGETLGLAPGQCYDDVPETTTTTSPPTTAPPTVTGEDDVDQTTTAPPTTERPPITTTIPRPPLIAIVSCEGTNAGVAFDAFCIGSLVPASEIIDLPSELGQVECDGDPDLDWPGDRLLRRAAARECVARFETVFDEPYATSEIGTTEFVPSRGVWERGDRRVVCTADQV
jgi:hypothetical protein